MFEARERLRREGGWERHLHVTPVVACLDGKPGLTQHLQHAPVLWQDDRFERVEAVRGGRISQLAEQNGRQPAALIFGRDGKGDLSPPVTRGRIQRVTDNSLGRTDSSQQA